MRSFTFKRKVSRIRRKSRNSRLGMKRGVELLHCNLYAVLIESCRKEYFGKQSYGRLCADKGVDTEKHYRTEICIRAGKYAVLKEVDE